MSTALFLTVFLTPVLIIMLYFGYGGKFPFAEKE